MFPIPWNFPFRKKDGSLSTISAEMGGTIPPATADKIGGIKVGSGLSVTSDGTLSGTNELPAYTIATAGKVLTVGDDGSLEWDDSGAGGGLYRGTTPPSNSLGVNGDMYIQSYNANIISSSGTGYIKTGIKPNAGYTIKTMARTDTPTSNYETIFGTRNGSVGKFTSRFTNSSSGALGAQWSRNPTADNASTTEYPSITKTTMLDTFTEIGLQYGGFLLVDGLIVARNGSSFPSNYDEFPYEWYLMALNDANTSSDYLVGSVKYCKIYDETFAPVAYLVPAFNNNVPTMYDLISGTYCVSENTSDLTITESNESIDAVYWKKVNNTWAVVSTN